MRVYDLSPDNIDTDRAAVALPPLPPLPPYMVDVVRLVAAEPVGVDRQQYMYRCIIPRHA